MSNGTNYVFWKVNMKTYIQSIGANVWDVMEEEYQKPLEVITKYENMDLTCNSKAMNSLLDGLLELELVKVMDCTIAKTIGENTSNCYEGDNKVKQDKLQCFRMQFDSLNINDYEVITKYFLRVNEVVNTIRGLDEKLDEPVVV